MIRILLLCLLINSTIAYGKIKFEESKGYFYAYDAFCIETIVEGKEVCVNKQKLGKNFINKENVNSTLIHTLIEVHDRHNGFFVVFDKSKDRYKVGALWSNKYKMWLGRFNAKLDVKTHVWWPKRFSTAEMKCNTTRFYCPDLFTDDLEMKYFWIKHLKNESSIINKNKFYTSYKEMMTKSNFRFRISNQFDVMLYDKPNGESLKVIKKEDINKLKIKLKPTVNPNGHGRYKMFVKVIDLKVVNGKTWIKVKIPKKARPQYYNEFTMLDYFEVYDQSVFSEDVSGWMRLFTDDGFMNLSDNKYKARL